MNKTFLPVVFLFLAVAFASSVSFVDAKGDDGNKGGDHRDRKKGKQDQAMPHLPPLASTLTPPQDSSQTTTTAIAKPAALKSPTNTAAQKTKPKIAAPKKISVTKVKPPIFFLSKGRGNLNSFYKTTTLSPQTTKDLTITAASLFGLGLLFLGKVDYFLSSPIAWIKDFKNAKI